MGKEFRNPERDRATEEFVSGIVAGALNEILLPGSRLGGGADSSGYRDNRNQTPFGFPTVIVPENTRQEPRTFSNPGDVRDAANQGHRLFSQGRHEEAARYLKYAAEGGDTSAQKQLGWMYEKGVGVVQDTEEAAAYYYDAAKQGDPQAMKNLGQMYEMGNGVDEDWEAAAYWYDKGARRGNLQAQEALARAYQFGIGVPQDRQAAIHWNSVALRNGGRADSAHWQRWLSSPTNFIGFRTEEERAMVMGNRLPTSSQFIGGDPEGMTFKNERERLNWIQQFAGNITAEEAERRSRQNQRPYRQDYYGPGTGRNWE